MPDRTTRTAREAYESGLPIRLMDLDGVLEPRRRLFEWVKTETRIDAAFEKLQTCASENPPQPVYADQTRSGLG
jgi:hypothetical protein